MEEEQFKIARQFTNITYKLQNTDWQIGIITTDSPCLRNRNLPITRNSADAEHLFEQSVSVGINGSGYESGIKMVGEIVSGALSAQSCVNPHWLRSDAKLATIFVSDENEDEYSGWRYFRLLTAIEDVGYVIGRTFVANGVYFLPGSSCEAAESAGIDFDALIRATGGLKGNICDEDFSVVFQKVSRQLQRFAQ